MWSNFGLFLRFFDFFDFLEFDFFGFFWGFGCGFDDSDLSFSYKKVFVRVIEGCIAFVMMLDIFVQICKYKRVSQNGRFSAPNFVTSGISHPERPL